MLTPSSQASVDMQCSQLADLHHELVITLVIQLAQLRQSLQHDCLGPYRMNMKSDENWALKGRNKPYVAPNAVRPKSLTTWTGLRTLEQLAPQIRQDRLSTAAAQIHSQESGVRGPIPEQVQLKDQIGPRLTWAEQFEH